LAGVDPQISISEPGLGQGCLGLFGLVIVLEDGDQESLGVEEQGPFTSSRVVVGHACWPDHLMFLHDGRPLSLP
jgi:hypothetical protein